MCERLVQRRLQAWMEQHDKIDRNQAGFRRGRGTLDQLAKLVQSVFDGFEDSRKLKTALALLDYKRAYDRVWHAGLKVKMGRLGIPACVISWTLSTLRDRRGRVRWDSTLSDSRLFPDGLAQGSILAPLLWLIYANDVLPNPPPDVQVSMYADDIAIWSTKKKFAECQEALQPVLDDITEWCRKWKVMPSVSKCSVTTFSLNTHESGLKMPLHLLLDGKQIPQVANPTFLGLTLDGALTFSTHVKQVKKAMASRRNCIAALAGRSYGSKKSTLRAAYIGYVRAKADYGAQLYLTHAAPSVRQSLEAEQHACARIITGCVRNTLRCPSGRGRTGAPRRPGQETRRPRGPTDPTTPARGPGAPAAGQKTRDAPDVPGEGGRHPQLRPCSSGRNPGPSPARRERRPVP